MIIQAGRRERAIMFFILKSEGVNRYYSWNKLFRLNYFEAAKLMKRETMTPDKITKWEFCNSSSRRE